MRAFKLFPKIQVATSNLSKDAQKRLLWFDFYLSHNKNASLTCRYFGISPDTFYLWKRRFNPRQLQSLEFDTKTRRPKRVREMTTPQDIQRESIRSALQIWKNRNMRYKQNSKMKESLLDSQQFKKLLTDMQN